MIDRIFKSLTIALIFLCGCKEEPQNDDFGGNCLYSKMQLDIAPDKGVCYKECVLAGTASRHPAWNTNRCINTLCHYKLICPSKRN